MKTIKKLFAAGMVAAALITTFAVSVSASIESTHSSERKYDTNDALAILKHIVGLEPLTSQQSEQYDFFDNGIINTNNALEILKYVVGIIEYPGGPPIVKSEFERLAEEVLRITNLERAKVGSPPLSMSHAALNEAAMLRAVEIQEKFAHSRPDGRHWSTVLDEFNIAFLANGENIARGNGLPTPQSVVDAWLSSKQGHREALLGITMLDGRDITTRFTHIGIGVYRIGDTYSWVQLFLQPKD